MTDERMLSHVMMGRDANQPTPEKAEPPNIWFSVQASPDAQRADGVGVLGETLGDESVQAIADGHIQGMRWHTNLGTGTAILTAEGDGWDRIRCIASATGIDMRGRLRGYGSIAPWTIVADDAHHVRAEAGKQTPENAAQILRTMAWALAHRDGIMA